MIRLLFVGDGDRDAVTVPHLVATIIGEFGTCSAQKAR